MAGTPKSISMIKQILHLQGLGYGIKTISRELRISKNTVKRYLRQAESKGLPPGAISSHSNETLEHILLEDNAQGLDKLSRLQQLFPDISQKLEETGFTLHYRLKKSCLKESAHTPHAIPTLPFLPITVYWNRI